ncbi:MAG: magnesium-protoporphyrin IX monomethyl ester cyclase, partial [Microcystis sp. M57BS1]|nr:magnesium-protoporphyrin IX monomethyl ester cyclase [Microcystis sp. M62BS1]MCA2515067.1 magnesium-protoporphyrin IX monomethyl ester cyclase [Microcystis sp. M59BS1]MCA2520025.1 magnesium-protoporphyrin IX monomethyl ester cyclase [Microcystis sp. M63BS1]MCA2532820.1 magnesium-protoporphyrin IX monomethyl ester cyclase [Microcystis sp. M51BS1]MCA2534229.1 magnesium-protoporphyrin IX monomethyl ester cyclase [Microcystis sp. M57BS1]MCA2543872.1 magnesium-protoporphyrin IX monomethyl ester 
VRERSDFYDALGMDAIAFDQEVIRQTNNTSARAFPTILNVDHPQFFPRLNRCAERNLQLKAIDESSAPQWLKTMRKLPLQLGIFGDLLRLYLIKPIDAEATREMVL